MKAKVFKLDGKSSSEQSLSKDVFGVEVRKDILHRVVNWQLAKRQAGTHSTKTRAEIRGGKKKPYKQKGTGSARQGSKVAPHMVGGGVAKGPRFRSHEHALPKKIRKLGLKSALSLKLKEGSLIILDDVKLGSPKTSEVLKGLGALKVDSALVVLDLEASKDFVRAVANVKKIDVLPVVGVNVYDILLHKSLILTKDVVDKLEERLV